MSTPFMPHTAAGAGPASAVLSGETCEEFLREGVVHVPSMFPPEQVTALLGITQELIESNASPTEHLADGFLSWRAVTTASPALAAVACDPRMVGPAVQILGASIRLVGSQLIHRIPHRGHRTVRTSERSGWHRDIYGMSADLGPTAPLCAIKFAIWLSDADRPEHGATRFLPGSHLDGLPAIAAGEIDPRGWCSFAPRRGDVTIFENRIFHAGGLNVSTQPLKVLMFQYGHRWLASVTRRVHAAETLSEYAPFAQQILEPDDCDAAGVYDAGSDTRVIRVWAENMNLRRYREPSAAPKTRR